MTKTCGTCKQIKPLDEFRWRPHPNGARHPRRICKDCENTDNRARMAVRQPEITAARAAKSAELAISGEITALIRATTSRRTTTPPRVTAEELAAWHQAGCPIAPHQRRRAAA